MGCALFRTESETWFRQARTVRGLTREELAKKTGLTVERIATLEAGAAQVAAREICAYAQATKLPPSFFLQAGRSLAFEGHISGSGITACPHCGYVADFLCDFPMGKGKTCDGPLCGRCTIVQPNGRDFCPAHAAIAAGMVTAARIARGAADA